MLFEFYDSIKALPGSTDARMLVVRRAQEYLEQMAAEARGNPAVLRDLAAAYERIGQILAGSRDAHLGGPGSFQQARQLLEKALAIRRGLAAANPADRGLQLDMMETLQDIAEGYQFEGDLPRAIELKRQRLELLERLAARETTENLSYDLGNALAEFGNLKLDVDYQSALENQHRGESVLRTLSDEQVTLTEPVVVLQICAVRCLNQRRKGVFAVRAPGLGAEVVQRANAPTGCPRRQGLRPQPARPPRLGGHTAGNCAAPRGATQDGRASHPLPGHPVPLAARRGKVTPRIRCGTVHCAALLWTCH
jgi:hypothetical protein